MTRTTAAVRLVFAMALAMVLSCAHAQGDATYQEAAKLFRDGQHAQALDRIDAILNPNPKDARARFLKGLILTEQNNTEEAIRIFTALSEDYPELPEPHNNLGVLYASQGRYDTARAALEMAIRTHPGYATAHENLGDVYVNMASQAYGKALQLDKSNATAQSKLKVIRELFSATGAQAAKPAADAGAAAAKPSAPKRPAPAASAAPATAGQAAGVRQ
jgi:tetratricopeptide (TPR) repeat protein